MLKRPTSHQIDTAAKKVFEGYLPDSWNFEEQQNDYGKDYLVEPAEHSLLSGEAFYVQLKGHAKANLNKSATAVSHAFHKKHLVYYADKVTQLPVFCVVVDLATRKAWYLFMQQYLFYLPDWRQKKKPSVYLPLENDLQNTEAFLAAISEAKAWMRRRNPYALRDAHTQEIERLKSIEPRCDYKLSFQDGVSHYELRAIQDMPMRMKISGEKATIGSKIENMLRGDRVWFAPGECKIEGTDLFTEIYEKGGGFQVQNTTSATLDLILQDDAGTVVGTLPGLEGEFKTGIAETHYKGKLRNSPFEVEVGPLQMHESGICKANFRFDPAAWFGQPVGRLAYFDQLNEFVNATFKTTSCYVQWRIDGNYVAKLSGSGIEKNVSEIMGENLSFIDAMRKVCEHLKIDATYGEDLIEHAEQFDQVFAMLFEGGWQGPFDTSFIVIEVSGVIDLPPEPQDYRLIFPYTFLEREIGTSYIDLSNTTAMAKSLDDGLIEVRLNGNPGSIRTLHLLEGVRHKPQLMSKKREDA